LPDKTLAPKGEACKGGKLAKERITVMLACSSTGEKLKPLVIGKAKQPRCFKNINIYNLPVFWQSNKKAWMTAYIFTEWITKINKLMKLKKRKVLLFLDNATSHAEPLVLSNVTLKFLPPNTTSKLQPLDLGIIRAFKARYRKHMLKHLITKIDSCSDVSLTKGITVLDVVHWIDISWKETKDSTIISCFRIAGFPVSGLSQCEEVEDDPDDDIPLAQLCNMVRQGSELNYDQMDEIESSLPTEETYDGDWEKSLLNEFKSRNVSDDEESNGEVELEEEAVDLTGSEFSYEDILERTNHMINFSNSKDDRFLTFLQPMKAMAEDAIIRKKMAKKQVTLDQFM